MLKTALEERAAGILITQANFGDAGGTGQVLPVDANEMIEILQLAITEKENPTAPTQQPLAAAMNFRTRRSET